MVLKLILNILITSALADEAANKTELSQISNIYKTKKMEMVMFGEWCQTT